MRSTNVSSRSFSATAAGNHALDERVVQKLLGDRLESGDVRLPVHAGQAHDHAHRVVVRAERDPLVEKRDRQVAHMNVLAGGRVREGEARHEHDVGPELVDALDHALDVGAL